jgi:hypothetical protein
MSFVGGGKRDTGKTGLSESIMEYKGKFFYLCLELQKLKEFNRDIHQGILYFVLIF